MKVDMFKAYKMLLQRRRRNADCECCSEASDRAEELAKNYPSLIQRKDTFASIASRTAECEAECGHGRGSYGASLAEALATGNIECVVPYPVQHRWNEAPGTQGYIYLATANSRPNSVKFGATGSDVDHRLSKFSHKYGYTIKCYWMKRVQEPFKIEKIVQDQIKNLRVSGLTSGESNEWYEARPETLLLSITGILGTISHL